MDKENEYKDIMGYIEEVKSSLIILKSAVQNENKDVSLYDIENQLEILNERMDLISNKILNLSTLLFK